MTWLRSVSAVAVVLLGLASLPAGAAAQGCLDAGCYEQVDVIGEAPATGHGVFRFPQGIAYSPGGAAIFVGDQYSGVVQRFSRAGAWQADIGSYADARQPGRLGTVGGLATDRAGHLYVLDSENDRVQVFDASSGQWLAAWGTRGTAEGRFRLGANTGAGGLAVDHPAAGALPTVYVADQNNHRVQAFRMTQSAGGRAVLPAGDRSGDVVDAPVPVEVWGSLGDCSTVGCAQPAFDDRLNYPQGIAVDPQPDAQGRRHVWVADDRNHRVVEYLPDGTYLRQIGSFGAGPGQFEFPYDVGIDARAPRQLYVLDNNNHRVQAFDVDTLAFAREWGLFGPQPGAFEYPRALAALADDPVGGVAVADNANNRVQTFGADGSVQAVWGIAGRGPGYVSRPGGLAIDAAGTIHIADTLADRLQRLGPDGAYAGQSGYISTRSGYAAPRDGPGEFDVPAAVVHDPLRGSIWVADTGNDRIQQLRPDGTWVATYTGGLSGPRAVAVDPGGRILVADTGNDRVQRLDPATGAWSTVALGGATVTRPFGVAATGDGTVYVADSTGDRILAVAPGGAVAPLPAPPGGAFARPTGLFGRGGDLWVADTGNSRVLRRDGATGTWDRIGGDGREPGRFVAPTGVAVSLDGRTLVVADGGNHRIQRFTLTGAAGPVATGVPGGAPPAASPAPPAAAQRPPGGSPPARAADRTAPALTGARLTPATFRAARSGGSLLSAGARAGATLRYGLTEAAELTLTAERVVAARRGAGRSRAVPVTGSIRLRSAAGPQRLRLSGRLAGRTLRPARYILVLRARDAVGNRGAARRVAFRIRR